MKFPKSFIWQLHLEGSFSLVGSWSRCLTHLLKVPGSNPTEWHFLFKTWVAKNVLRTVNNALAKIIGKNSGLFAMYFSTAVLQQCFQKAYFGQKSGCSYSIFERPIFWPNPLNSTSILGHLLRTRKNYPKIEVLLRGLGPKIGPLKMMSQYPLFVKKAGICTPFLRALFFDLILLVVPRFQGSFCEFAKNALKSRYY